MTEEEKQDFFATVDAVEDLLSALFYSASLRNTAEYLVDELPSRGYKIVKMTDEEIKLWEGENPLIEDLWEDEEE